MRVSLAIVVERKRRGVLLWQASDCVAWFRGRSVQARPWPPSAELVELIAAYYDELLDAGVSAAHPLFLDCPECSATLGGACLHKRTGEPIHSWHQGRRL